MLRPGLSELEVAGILEKALRDEGSEEAPFSPIVASGPRLVESLELLAHTLHPDRHPLPAGLSPAKHLTFS